MFEGVFDSIENDFMQQYKNTYLCGSSTQQNNLYN